MSSSYISLSQLSVRLIPTERDVIKDYSPIYFLEI